MGRRGNTDEPKPGDLPVPEYRTAYADRGGDFLCMEKRYVSLISVLCLIKTEDFLLCALHGM